MESTLVRRDQFNVTPQGIVHKPTDAAFTPYPGDPFSGIERSGQLANKHPNGSGFRAEDVRRMMRELWAEYVTTIRNCLTYETSAGRAWDRGRQGGLTAPRVAAAAGPKKNGLSARGEAR